MTTIRRGTNLYRNYVVDLNEESSNRLFAVLSDWNRALQASEQGDFSSLKCR